MTENDYTIPKPSYPVAARILGGMVVVGLIGLGVAAYAAFSFIGRPVQALAFALIVEAGMISEAIAIVRRNWLSIPGLVVSLLVSGSYNFTQAERAGHMLTPPLTDPIQLAALSIGPLSAVLFLALAAGHELQEHEKHVRQWEVDRQKWLDDQAERQARRQERREARQEKAATLETAKQLPPTSAPLLPDFVEKDGSSIETSRGSYADFVELLRSNGHHDWKNEELSRKFQVSTRTITTWRARYAQENPIPVQEVN